MCTSPDVGIWAVSTAFGYGCDTLFGKSHLLYDIITYYPGFVNSCIRFHQNFPPETPESLMRRDFEMLRTRPGGSGGKSAYDTSGK
jgi:hypothetical protein